MIKLSRLTIEEIEKILDEASEFAKGKVSKAKDEIYVSNMFFEDSTRTKMSFEIAQKKLGLNIVNFDAEKSSLKKGETLMDTIRTLEAIGIELAVIRHSKTRYFDELKEAKLAIVNAGDGIGTHPTQAILDALTIKQEFGKIEGLKVGIIGDVKHSRVANSTSMLLRRLGAKVNFSGPEFLFDEAMLINGIYHPIDEIIKESDVIIMLRVQNERHQEGIKINTEDYLKKYGLTKERERKMKLGAIIMHPAPINRGVEIDDELVDCPRSRIFKQMENGVFARMAILKRSLQNKGFHFEDVK